MGRAGVRAAVTGVLTSSVLVLALAACAGSSGEPAASGTPAPTPAAPTTRAAIDDVPLAGGASGAGLPPGAEAGSMGGPGAGWTAQDGLLYVVTYGSSTCPILAESPATSTGTTLVVTLTSPSSGPCTMDLAPTTSVVAVPDAVDESAPVRVDLGHDQVVTVAPRPAAGAAGPIAWVAAG
ncbi:hypothetical protein [Cellulomonas alba]|uniref:Secreted protein n=1 Tax=Cellulomonas alba TaxID=3053467 RepID=A0ABT7SBB2_9CELL|nr:hypothetical protein [Cellulomonas alba]MDM7853473.1 hypothetical protein [Cellulomonas alba]